ncbi:hypothetical protein CcI49_34545 [Frankia sp. CcI49]|uniref:pentapeptide repeat-containing protein n=1 Tax=unclassified Frankia TaxID=2632575 RepID=UPI0006CA450F|nr:MULTISPECIES: pentapeptide repeat-containing protein [unclassified Frankia]ONH52044.1 hypothetical protein CcI49_34545 [Frankia sp. CcI49]
MAEGESGSFVFVSYTGADEAWATWVAAVLEGAGLAARVQVWDSQPGTNFVEWMNSQLATAQWTVALYSKAYFASQWCTTEWTAALARKTLLPVRLESVTPPDSLATLTWVDLFDLDEVRARERLLYAVGIQVLPRLAVFPGRQRAVRPTFPGLVGQQPPAAAGVTVTDPAVILAAALDQIGSPTMPVRLAGIRALQRAADDPNLVDEIVQVLIDYLHHSVRRGGETAEKDRRAAAAALSQLSNGQPVDLIGADLENIDVVELGLTRANFNSARLGSADFTGVDLSGINFAGAGLWGANFTDSEASGANFAHASFGGAKFTRASLIRANLVDASFDRADLGEANLSGANLAGASLRNTRLAKVNLADADLTKVKLTYSNLDNANLTNANLAGADLTGADLTGANLTGVDLTGADITKASLADADLTDANLARVRGLGRRQLNLTRGSARTVIPEGVSRPRSWPSADAARRAGRDR